MEAKPENLIWTIRTIRHMGFSLNECKAFVRVYNAVDQKGPRKLALMYLSRTPDLLPDLPERMPSREWAAILLGAEDRHRRGEMSETDYRRTRFELLRYAYRRGGSYQAWCERKSVNQVHLPL